MLRKIEKMLVVLLAGTLVLTGTSCGSRGNQGTNLVAESGDSKENLGNGQPAGNEKSGRTVNLFSPMEKSSVEGKNASRTAQDATVLIAEEELGLTVEYRTYTAETYKEKTYDDVLVERAKNGMDDLYLMNPDVIQTLGADGTLADLSSLKCVANLRDVVKTANMVNGKLVAIPQEVVTYGLFVNKDMFDKYNLKLPETPEEFLECCRVFKENGIETPVGANRWWLECFVLAMGYAYMYNGGNTEAEIEALNSGAAKLSEYMRPGFKFLKEMMDRGYIDAETALTYEAIEGEGPDFKAQKTPIVMAYWGAANSETLYGNLDFNMQVIGFPSSMGQMPVISMTGYGILANAEHYDDAMAVLDVMLSDSTLEVYTQGNQVISPSKNVSVDCKDDLKPLNSKVDENIYVLGSNANMKVEQWGNTCLIVRDLLGGASVEECMMKFDELQEVE